MKYEDAILKGNFDCALLDKSKYEAQINDVIKISVENIYQSTEVVDKEIAGYGVINTLLNTYTSAVNNSYNNVGSNYDELILKGLAKSIKANNSSLYNRLSSVCYYVSLLSDSKAILEYKKIKGIEF